jgi:hypothetical protein
MAWPARRRLQLAGCVVGSAGLAAYVAVILGQAGDSIVKAGPFVLWQGTALVLGWAGTFQRGEAARRMLLVASVMFLTLGIVALLSLGLLYLAAGLLLLSGAGNAKERPLTSGDS